MTEREPRERPILFGQRQVQSILAGRKTQTRRPIKRQIPDHHWIAPRFGVSPDGFAFGTNGLWIECGPDYPDGPDDELRCPYQSGDRLWVRETWTRWDAGLAYRADTTPEGERQRIEYGIKWRPSIHMPRSASRITLKVLAVRAEQVRAISDADAVAEGFDTRAAFFAGWDSIYAPDAGVVANPWTWVCEFRLLEVK